MSGTGLIHLYCGDGKGKTTAAVGLAVRHAGAGGKVVLAPFLKDGTSGECRALAGLKNVTMLAANPCGKFSFQMSGEEKQECRAAVGRTFAAATGFAVREGATLLVLDEVCAAVNRGFLDEDALLAFLDGRPEGLEVVLTGRGREEGRPARAECISVTVKARPPNDRGVGARKGIEV